LDFVSKKSTHKKTPDTNNSHQERWKPVVEEILMMTDPLPRLDITRTAQTEANASITVPAPGQKQKHQ
jgi:hypothetical protein